MPNGAIRGSQRRDVYVRLGPLWIAERTESSSIYVVKNPDTSRALRQRDHHAIARNGKTHIGHRSTHHHAGVIETRDLRWLAYRLA